MNIDEIEQSLSRIKHAANVGDFEVAHGEEDILYTAVLEAISRMGHTDAAILARTALKANRIHFTRCYA